jgi:hypothetical protein
MPRRTFPHVFPLIIFLLIGLVVVAVIGMSTGSWVAFGIALGVHLVGTAIVVTGQMRRATLGTEADESSKRLATAGRDAAGTENPNHVEELEALTHEEPHRPA